METGKISIRYARAIYEYALEKDNEKLLYKAMQMLIRYFSLNPAMRKIIHNPTISDEEKRKIFLLAFGGYSNILIPVVKMIVENGRASYMERIALMYEKEYRKNKRIIVAHLTTAQVATDDIKEILSQFLEKRMEGQMEFHMQINSEIIGGFILKIEDKLLDGSVRRQLNQIKCQI